MADELARFGEIGIFEARFHGRGHVEVCLDQGVFRANPAVSNLRLGRFDASFDLFLVRPMTD